MNQPTSPRLTLVWLLLVAATLAAWVLGHGEHLASPAWANVAILMVAMVKVALVIWEFMEVRHAPRLMQALAAGWWLVASAGLSTLLLRAAG